MNILNNSDKLIIVLHEIYGINQHIRMICEHYAKDGFDIICPDLINRAEPFEYRQEDLAYRSFQESIGFQNATDQVSDILKKEREQYKHIFLLGFSIGATVAWICSGNEIMCDGVIGYYGSRIRDYLNVLPLCPVSLIYPTEEKSFAVRDLAHALNEHENIEFHVLKGKHGFADMFSVNYLEESHKESIKIVDEFINKTVIYNQQSVLL